MAMTTSVSNGTTIFTPTVVDGYDSDRSSATIVHQILNRSNPDVSIRPAAMRTGTLRLVFADSINEGHLVQEDGYVFYAPDYSVNGEADSLACVTAHAAGGVFTLTSTDRGTVQMSYVPNGRIARSLDDETRGVWIVEVDYHEVSP